MSPTVPAALDFEAHPIEVSMLEAGVSPRVSRQPSAASPALVSTASASAARWRVIKIGGTSMASESAVKAATERSVTEAADRPMAVVVSALAGTTDQLARLLDAAAGDSEGVSSARLEMLRTRHHHHLGTVATGSIAVIAARVIDRHVDRLAEIMAVVRDAGQLCEDLKVEALALGERLAAEIMVAACRAASSDIEVQAIDPGEVLVASGPLLDAEVDCGPWPSRPVDTAQIAGRLWVMPGFFARGHDRRLRLLGRGGSDTSATLLGSILGADRVEIWTDVDGIFPRDPRHHAGQQPFTHLSYDQAEHMARGGARVLHAKSIAPARSAGVPVLVRNSFRLKASGTWIGGRREVRS